MDTITTNLWQETPSDETPFRPKQCLCAGYDVYEDLAGNATFSEYIYLLFKREQPNAQQVELLNNLSICIGNLGPRDHGVQAAMTAGAGGAGAAASLIAALSASAGQFSGGHELATVCQKILDHDGNLLAWENYIQDFSETNNEFHNDEDVWPTEQHIPGFDPYTPSTTRPIRIAINKLAAVDNAKYLKWLSQHIGFLETKAKAGLAMSFVAAAALSDLGLEPEESEMLFLILRLPGAAAHSLEQRWRGWQDFPFYPNGINLNE